MTLLHESIFQMLAVNIAGVYRSTVMVSSGLLFFQDCVHSSAFVPGGSEVGKADETSLMAVIQQRGHPPPPPRFQHHHHHLPRHHHHRNPHPHPQQLHQ